MRLFIAAFLSLAALGAPASAAEEPDAVYAKYHRAAAAGDLDGMAQYAQAAQRAELLSMSAAQKSAMVKMLAATMPRAFALRNKSVAADGRTARLVVSGPTDVRSGLNPEILYGSIRMAMEGGEWKVGETEWTNNPPAGLAASTAAKSAVPATAKSAAPTAKSAPPARGGGGLVGSTATPPERKLGMAKEPCVYKPVMTAEDLENCK